MPDSFDRVYGKPDDPFYADDLLGKKHFPPSFSTKMGCKLSTESAEESTRLFPNLSEPACDQGEIVNLCLDRPITIGESALQRQHPYL